MYTVKFLNLYIHPSSVQQKSVNHKQNLFTTMFDSADSSIPTSPTISGSAFKSISTTLIYATLFTLEFSHAKSSFKSKVIGAKL